MGEVVVFSDILKKTNDNSPPSSIDIDPLTVLEMYCAGEIDYPRAHRLIMASEAGMIDLENWSITLVRCWQYREEIENNQKKTVDPEANIA